RHICSPRDEHRRSMGWKPSQSPQPQGQSKPLETCAWISFLAVESTLCRSFGDLRTTIGYPRDRTISKLIAANRPIQIASEMYARDTVSTKQQHLTTSLSPATKKAAGCAI